VKSFLVVQGLGFETAEWERQELNMASNKLKIIFFGLVMGQRSQLPFCRLYSL